MMSKFKSTLKSIQRSTEEDELDDAQYAVKIVGKIIRNILISPDDQRYRVVRLEKPAMSKIADAVPKALKLLELVGFELKNRENPYYCLDGELSHKESDKLAAAYEITRKIGLKSFSDGGFSLTEEDLPNLLDNDGSFDPYKPSKTFLNPALAKISALGQNNSFERLLEDLKLERERLIEESGTPERHFIAFSDVDDARSFSQRVDWKDLDSSSDRKADRKLILEAGKAAIEKSKRNQRLTTKAVRDYEALKNQPVYTRALIRVQFPDRSVLQAFFSPLEKVSKVIEYFSQSLKGSLRTEMYLFQTPPKREFDPDMTLEELRLVPCALIHAGFRRKPSTPEFFKQSVATALVNRDWESVKDRAVFEFSRDFVKYVS